VGEKGLSLEEVKTPMRITKMTTRRCVGAFACVALLGCATDDVTAPNRTLDPANTIAPSTIIMPGKIASLSTTASTQSVSGNVTITAQPDPTQPAVVFDYSFSANQKLEALALTPSFIQGQFHFAFFFSNVNVVVDGSVACFFVIGNKARIAGVVDRTSDPVLFPVASTMIWSVTDNDNMLLPVTLPAAAPARVPDTASPLLRLPGVDPLTYCLAGGFVPELPVIRGQVQVKSD
jgi:hypothetical protein